MILKSFTDIVSPTIKKWAVHRGDGLLLKHTIADSKLEAMRKFLARKHSDAASLTQTGIELRWRFWGKYNDVNEMNLTFEQYHALVNENPNG